MKRMHCFEVIGTVLLRPSGNAGFPPVECKVIATRARLLHDGTVWFNELSTGHDEYTFPSWFEDWTDSDNMHSKTDSAYPFQEGRQVHIAVPVVVYDEILRTGTLYPRRYVIGGDEETRARLSGRARSSMSDMVQTPIAAVKIDGYWVAPEPQRDPMVQHRLPDIRQDPTITL